MAVVDPRQDMDAFRAVLQRARNVVVLTGAGISAESGVPTFRGSSAQSLWRRFSVTDLATPEAFERDPSLVWCFYEYRRRVVRRAEPNAGHTALAELAKRFEADGRTFRVMTQNIDGLHLAGGLPPHCLLELHGSLWNVKRVKEPRFRPAAGVVWEDRSLLFGDDDVAADAPPSADGVAVADLPHITEPDGSSTLLRPAVVWFGEALDGAVLRQAQEWVDECDVFLTIGTSAVVYPAAGFIVEVGTRPGTTVAEFNLEDTPVSDGCAFAFRGPSGTMLPALLDGFKLQPSDGATAAPVASN